MITQELVGDVTSPLTGIIGHGVNCQGVMGSGVALTIRQKFPAAYEAYLELCRVSDPHNLLGTTQIVEVAPDLYVANMFTQFTFGRDGGPYASIQAVREACAFLKSGREQLLIDRQATEVDAVFDCVKYLYANHPTVDFKEDSDRTLLIRRRIERTIAAVHDVQADDPYGSKYELPIYLPLIGCGLGGLNWDTVRPSIHSHTGSAPVTIYHYQK